VRAHAYALDATGPLTAQPLHTCLQALAPTGGQVVVVGSGPTGIEAAAEIASCFPNLRVTMVTQGPFGSFTQPHIQSYMRQALLRLHIQIREQVIVSEVQSDAIIIGNGERISFDCCVWAGGFRASSLPRVAGVQVNQRQQILTSPYLHSLSHPTIYAVGDAVAPVHNTGAPVRMSLVTALVTGAHVADNISRLIKGQSQKPLGFSTYGQGIALGRNDAVGFNTFPNDRPVGPLVTGRAGLKLRNFFVWLLLFVLTLERYWPGFFFWLGRNRGQDAAAAWLPLPDPTES
jgi:NADH dehydrogenase